MAKQKWAGLRTSPSDCAVSFPCAVSVPVELQHGGGAALAPQRTEQCAKHSVSHDPERGRPWRGDPRVEGPSMEGRSMEAMRHG